MATGLPAVPQAQLDIQEAQLALIRQGQILANTAATVAGARATDSDNDGTLEPLAMRAGGGPADGGLLPSGSAVVSTDGWGTPLGYCAWDHGAVQGATPGQAFAVAAPAAGRLIAARNASGNGVLLAVIFAGPNRSFDTTCAHLAAGGAALGDDHVAARDLNQTLLAAGVSFSRPPVDHDKTPPTALSGWSSSLQKLLASATDSNPLVNGELRLVTADNTLWRYSANGVSQPGYSYLEATGDIKTSTSTAPGNVPVFVRVTASATAQTINNLTVETSLVTNAAVTINTTGSNTTTIGNPNSTTVIGGPLNVAGPVAARDGILTNSIGPLLPHGTLSVATGGGSIATAGGSISTAGGSIDTGAGAATVGGLTVNGATQLGGALSVTGLLSAGGGIATDGGNINAGSGSGSFGSLAVAGKVVGGGSASFQGLMSAGVNDLAGTNTLSGTNALTGDTYINSGASTGATAIGTGPTAGAVSIGRSGGTVTLGHAAGAANSPLPVPVAGPPNDRFLVANADGTVSQVSFGALAWLTAGNSLGAAWNGSSGHYVGSASAQPLVLATTHSTGQDIRFFTGPGGASERLRVSADGQLGVGVKGPVARLDVAGGIRLGDHLGCTAGTHDGTLRFSAGQLQICGATGWQNVITSSTSAVPLHGYVFQDTRHVNQPPSAWGPATADPSNPALSLPSGVYRDFKSNAVLGIPTGSYSALETIVPGSDDSGGAIHQLAYNSGGGIYYRYGTRAAGWTSWQAYIAPPSGPAPETWNLGGNSSTSAWNGATGSYLGTTSAQPLVLATTHATAQDIVFFTGANGAAERLRIAGATGHVGVGSAAPPAPLTVRNRGGGPSYSVGLLSEAFAAAANSPAALVGSFARGSSAAPAAVAHADPIARFAGAGYTGTQYIDSAWIITEVDGAVSAGSLPQAISLRTGDTGTPAERLRISASGRVSTAQDLRVNGLTVGRGAGNAPDNVALGLDALRANTTGTANTALGAEALLGNVGGQFNTAVGAAALRANTAGTHSAALGWRALYSNTVGIMNTAVGVDALYANLGGTHNVALGVSALFANVSGTHNVALGVDALKNNTTGAANVAVGFDAGRVAQNGEANTTGSGSVFIGQGAQPQANGEWNQIVIGVSAVGIGSNSVSIGNQHVSRTRLNGSVGIETSAPVAKLDVRGGVRIGGHDFCHPDGTHDGTLRFTSGQLQLCVGGTWRDSGSGWGLIGSATSSAWNGSAGSGPFLGTTSAQPLVLATTNAVAQDIRFYTGANGASERMRIGANGRVGIGTTGATHPLHVSGTPVGGATVRLSSAANQDNHIRVDFPSDSARYWGLGADTAGDAFMVWLHSGQVPFRIDTAGVISMGSGAAYAAHTLNVAGKIASSGIDLVSDARFKVDVRPIAGAAALLEKLQGVSYEWNRAAHPGRNFAAGRQVGVIAQQVEKVAPELVTTGADGFKSVNYVGFVPLLIEGVKEQQVQLRAHDTRLTAQARRLDEQQALLLEHGERLEEHQRRIGRAERAIGRFDERAGKLEIRIGEADDRITRLTERADTAEGFLARFDTSRPDVLAVKTPNFVVSNLTAERAEVAELRARRLHAEQARFKTLEADEGRMNGRLQAQSVSAQRVASGEREMFVSYGTVAPLFEVPEGAHFVVTITSPDGSYAFASVARAGGQLRLTPTAAQGIDLVPQGTQVGVVAPSRRIKASWLRTG